jgi:hypothetical protein
MIGEVWRVAVGSLVLIGALGLAAGGVGPAGQVLTVTDVETGERLLAVPVEDGTVVALDYTHSVERTPVHDHYVVRDGTLVMTRMTFESYGWGLPAGADVELVNGTFVAEPNRTFTAVTVAPGRLAGHRLTVGDQTIDLVALSDGRSVRLAVRDGTALVPGRSVVEHG